MKLLYVEDNADAAADLTALLAREGCQVVWEMRGADGLRRAALEQFDTIILDRMLPDMDGLEIVQRLRSTGVDTPVLMLSALGRASNRVEGLDAGVDDYLAKPYEPEELMARLKALVRRAEGRTHSAIIIYGQFECHLKPVTIASVFKLAQISGWQAPTPVPSPQAYSGQTAFRLLDRAAIMAQPQLRWRVKGIYPESGIAAIYGASGSGKSFLAKDLAICIAKGARWFGHRVSASAVTYIMLEAEAGLRNRVQAWEDHNKQQIPPTFLAMAQPFELADDEQVEQLGAVLPQGGVTIIDTLNRAAPGLDENSSQDMGRILADMKRLQAITNGLVIIVHHTGKDASKGLRGHSSLHAGLDGAIEVERVAASRFWSAAKVKDGEDGKRVAFKLHVIDLGKDADGDPMTSCAVGPDTGAIFEHKEPSGKRQLPAYRAIVRELGAATNIGMGGASAQTCSRARGHHGPNQPWLNV